MVAQVAEPHTSSAPSLPQQNGLDPEEPDRHSDSNLDSTKTLICALNFLSRNLPLPQHVYDAVSSIYLCAAEDGGGDGVLVDDVIERAEVGVESSVEGLQMDEITTPRRMVSCFILFYVVSRFRSVFSLFDFIFM